MIRQDRLYEKDSVHGSTPDAAYQDLTGKKLPEGKLAFALPLHLGVTDEETQGDQLLT